MDCDSENNSEPTVDHHEKENLVRSQFYDVMVKVDAHVYCLNKLQLAWKSDYFEKLLIQYSDQEECNFIQLPVMDTDTFSAIVDIIYGKALTSVLNRDNYITLLMAMDYLQMEIDLKTYASFIEKNSVMDVKIFRLYNFVRENPNLRCLLPPVLKYLSVHLTEVQNRDEFLSLPLNDIIGIILGERDKEVVKCMGICQICSKWICHDLGSRLSHAAKVVNAVRRRFLYFNSIKEENFNGKVTHIGDHPNPDVIAKLLCKFSVFNGEINPVCPELPKDENIEDRISTGAEKNEQKKLAKLLENNYFYDIVVKVEQKTYKLHRFKLTSASSYFAEIFSSKQSNAEALCAETSPTQQPNENNEYLLRDVDQTTFDLIIKYIYFNELPITTESITSVLKAANILRIEKLFDECVSWMRNNIEDVCSKVLFIDECVCRSWIKENMGKICSQVLLEPETVNVFPMCSISFDMLEDLLVTSPVCCVNPDKILDICSKWVMDDVKNRYHLIPKIAVGINHNLMIECDDYKMEEPVDFSNFSEQLIRDKLRNTLRSTSLVSTVRKMSEKDKMTFDKIPTFIAYSRDRVIHILNAHFNQIASFSVTPAFDINEVGEFPFRFLSVAATLMSDNLFIVFVMPAITYHLPLFYVYNTSSGKFICLDSSSMEGHIPLFGFSLLNCRGQIYWCFKNGHVFKYSIELNRWEILSRGPVSDERKDFYRNVCFTSDGTKLYRMCRNTFIMYEFCFEQNRWSSVRLGSFAYFPVRSGNYSDFPIDLTIISGGKIAIIFSTYVALFDQRTGSWREIHLPPSNYTYTSLEQTSFALTQCQDQVLHVICNRLYHWSDRREAWELHSVLPLRSDLPSDRMKEPEAYKYISAVHQLENNLR